MRHFVGLFGLLCSAIVITVAARYGLTLSDNETDGYIWAFIFGAVTFAGLGGHMLGVRLWRYGKRVFALVIFAAASFALVISLSNSLGAMAGRMNTTAATRTQTNDAVAADQNDLSSKQEERKGLKFEPTDQAAVDAAQSRAKAATAAKDAECNVRGQRCGDKEEAEKQALAYLTAASKNKAVTDQAHKLDDEIEKLKANIGKAGPVLEANSAGSALARLFNLPTDKESAARLSTYQQLAMAIVIEIIIMLSLIAYEIMTEYELERMPKPAPAFAPVAPVLPVEIEPEEAIAIAPPVMAPTIEEREEPQEEQEAPTATIEPEPEETAPRTFPPRRPRLIASEAAPFGNVAEILGEALETSVRGKLELAPVFRAYSDACRTQGKRPVSQDRFVDDLTAFCRDTGIVMTGDETGIYLRKVRLKKSGREANA